jgi:hypothetical protein
MIRELLHALPAPALFVVVVAAVLVPLAVLVYALRLDRLRADRADDNVLTAAIRFVGGAFALLAAFIIVSLANQSSAAKAAVRSEAAAADSFAREAARLPGDEGKRLVRGVEQYLDAVLRDEWPSMSDPAHAHDAADDEMDRLFDLLLADDASAASGRDDQRIELVVNSLDRLQERRVERILIARDPLAPVLWIVLLVSAATMLVVAAVYPAGTTRALKWVQVLSIGTVVAIVLFVVLALEHAYDGFLAVKPHALAGVLQELRAEPRPTNHVD